MAAKVLLLKRTDVHHRLPCIHTEFRFQCSRAWHKHSGCSTGNQHCYAHSLNSYLVSAGSIPMMSSPDSSLFIRHLRVLSVCHAVHPGRSLTEKKSVLLHSFPKKSPRALHVFNHG